MKFAPVMPARWMPALDNGDYHLVNSHTVGLENGLLVDWLRNLAIDKTEWLILDNGAYELGEAQTEEYFRVVYAVGPNVIVCPDNPQNLERSLDLLHDWMPRCMDCKSRGRANEVMVVPQGLSPKEWFDSLQLTLEYTMEKFNYMPYIGVPKYLEMWGRVGILSYLTEFIPGETIHVLGTYSSFDEIVTLANMFPEVRGADSTWPVAYALSEGDFGLMPLTGGFKYAIPNWNGDYKDRGDLIRANIATCRRRLR